jgi:GntR family transcriptional regulator
MKIIINSSSMVPIYEQIVDQVKAQIISGELKEDDNLPSVRTLSKELRISALTVKKAYDSLEQERFTVTIHGKGTYVAAANKEMMMEEYRREVEEELTEVIRKAKRYGLSEEDIREMLELILEG